MLEGGRAIGVTIGTGAQGRPARGAADSEDNDNETTNQQIVASLQVAGEGTRTEEHDGSYDTCHTEGDDGSYGTLHTERHDDNQDNDNEDNANETTTRTSLQVAHISSW